MCIKCALLTMAQTLSATDAEIILNTLVDLGYRGEIMSMAVADLAGNDADRATEAIAIATDGTRVDIVSCVEILQRCEMVTRILKATSFEMPSGTVPFLQKYLSERRRAERKGPATSPNGKMH